jgi:hypothetical protein
VADDDSDPASAGSSDGDRERAREERAAARRQLLDFEPGNVRDLDAAAACECSCHPRPGQTDKHSGDLCSCQWTNTDRAMHLVEFNSIFEEQRLEVEALQRGNLRAPDLDPWRAPASARLVVVRSGDSSDLFTGQRVNYRRAVRVIASVVRTQLRREACAHPHHEADRFCPTRGVPPRDEATPFRPDHDHPQGEDERDG